MAKRSKYEDEIQEDFFSAELFIDKNYVKKEFTFGEVTVEALLLDSASTDFDLTGQVLWPAAKVLSNFIIAQKQIFQNKSVLEVGSGIGLCGLLVSRFAGETYLSDSEDVVMELLLKNVDLNKPHAPQLFGKQLRWGIQEHIDAILKLKPQGFDFIIGSDVVYWQSSIVPLLTTVSQLLSKDGQFILCYQSRALVTDRFLLKTSEEMGLEHQQIPLASFTPEDKKSTNENAEDNANPTEGLIQKIVYLIIFKKKVST